MEKGNHCFPSGFYSYLNGMGQSGLGDVWRFPYTLPVSMVEDYLSTIYLVFSVLLGCPLWQWNLQWAARVEKYNSHHSMCWRKRGINGTGWVCRCCRQLYTHDVLYHRCRFWMLGHFYKMLIGRLKGLLTQQVRTVFQ